jgi:hypothetical protein
MNDFLQSLRNGQAEKPRTPKTRKNSDNSYHYTSSPRFHSNGGYQNTRSQQPRQQPPQTMSYHGGNQLPAEDLNMNLLADILDNLSVHVETMVKNQEYMVNAQERTADILERQAIAIERIVNHLNLSPETAPAKKEMDAQPIFENHYVTSRESKDTLKNKVQNTPKHIPENEPENKIAEPIEEPPAKKVQKVQVKPQVKKNITPSKPILRKRKKVTAKKAIEPAPDKAELMPRDAVMDIIQSMRKEGATFGQVAHRLIELGQPTFSGRGEWHAQTIHRLCSKK